jgi:hypothetical protein
MEAFGKSWTQENGITSSRTSIDNSLVCYLWFIMHELCQVFPWVLLRPHFSKLRPHSKLYRILVLCHPLFIEPGVYYGLLRLYLILVLGWKLRVIWMWFINWVIFVIMVIKVCINLHLRSFSAVGVVLLRFRL